MDVGRARGMSVTVTAAATVSSCEWPCASDEFDPHTGHGDEEGQQHERRGELHEPPPGCGHIVRSGPIDRRPDESQE